jgi:hypothetical protein
MSQDLAFLACVDQILRWISWTIHEGSLRYQIAIIRKKTKKPMIRERERERERETHTSKCSFHSGFRFFLVVVVTNFSTPSTDTTTKGSGTRKRFRFGRACAVRTGDKISKIVVMKANNECTCDANSPPGVETGDKKRRR